MKRKIKYILITKTVPEWSKRDNTLYTCSIGLSPELGLIRLYPLPPTGMNKYGIYELFVEKNKRDHRIASWKLSSYSRKEEWTTFGDDLNYLGQSNEKYVGEWLNRYVSPSISTLNKLKQSVGVLDIDPVYFHAFWDTNKSFINSCQIGMFEDVELSWFASYTKSTKEKDLRIRFRDMDGMHNLQFNEWHFYEGQRMFGAKPEILDPINSKKRNLLLIGNQLQYQNNWMGLGKFAGSKNMLLFSIFVTRLKIRAGIN